jgi:hypothetical protein
MPPKSAFNIINIAKIDRLRLWLAVALKTAARTDPAKPARTCPAEPPRLYQGRRPAIPCRQLLGRHALLGGSHLVGPIQLPTRDCRFCNFLRFPSESQNHLLAEPLGTLKVGLVGKKIAGSAISHSIDARMYQLAAQMLKSGSEFIAHQWGSVAVKKDQILLARTPLPLFSLCPPSNRPGNFHVILIYMFRARVRSLERRKDP